VDRREAARARHSVGAGVRILLAALLLASLACGRSLTSECRELCLRIEPDAGCSAGPATCDCGQLCPKGFSLVKDAGTACAAIPQAERIVCQ
jgi:hypothetical protein